MSTTDHPASFYQHNDITDPTLYEDEPKQWGNLECPICERPIYHGEYVILFNHDDLVRTIAMHKDCFCIRQKKDERFDIWTFIQQFMEGLEFEIEEGYAP